MITKALYGVGYISGVGIVNAKRVRQVLFDNRFKKQREQIKLGLEAAQIKYVANHIEKSLIEVTPSIGTDLSIMWDPKDLRKAHKQAKSSLSYQGFDSSIFDKAKMNLIEKYSSSEEVTQTQLAPSS
jgi:hypothetical protein